jgi:NADPH:quinone reductase-like Zn-dependent oxidoreductase
MPKVLLADQVNGSPQFVLREVEACEPGPGEVRYQVRAIGLNHADLLYLAGSHYTPSVLPSRVGYEASGVVDAVGDGVTRFAVGDKVMAMPLSDPAYAVAGEFAITPEDFLIRWPEIWDEIEAAAAMMPSLTAYYPLHEIAGTGPGDAVYINAASSSVGLTAIQMAKLTGATAIAGTRIEGKIPLLREAGADHVIVTEAGDVAGQIRAATGDRGVNVVVDAVAGSSLHDYAEAVARDGWVFIYGALNGDSNFAGPILPLLRNKVRIEFYSLINYLADARLRNRGRVFVELATQSGRLKPYVDSVFDLADFELAYDRMRSGQQSGKIVLRTGSTGTSR